MTISVSTPELVGIGDEGILAPVDFGVGFAALDEVRIAGGIPAFPISTVALGLFDSPLFDLSGPFLVTTTVDLFAGVVSFPESLLPDLLPVLADGNASFGIRVFGAGLLSIGSVTVTVRGTPVPEPRLGGLAAVAVGALVWRGRRVRLHQSYVPSAHQAPASRSW